VTAPIWIDEWNGVPISHSIIRPEAERLVNTAVIRVGVHGEDPEEVVRDLVGVWISHTHEGEPMSAESLRAESVVAMIRLPGDGVVAAGVAGPADQEETGRGSW